jgi:uncharacterized membrane protein
MKSKKINRVVNILSFAALQLACLASFSLAAYAGDYAEKGARWLLGQAGWVIAAAAIFAVAKLAIARNVVAAVTVFIVGAVLWFLTQFPEAMKTAGETVAGLIGLN